MTPKHHAYYSLSSTEGIRMLEAAALDLEVRFLVANGSSTTETN